MYLFNRKFIFLKKKYFYEFEENQVFSFFIDFQRKTKTQAMKHFLHLFFSSEPNKYEFFSFNQTNFDRKLFFFPTNQTLQNIKYFFHQNFFLQKKITFHDFT